MRFERLIFPALQRQVDTPDIIVLTGMRRVGKTTLLKMIYDGIESDNKAFIDLENILDQKIFEEQDYNNIWANLGAYGISNTSKAFIFLDELQAKPEAVPALKYLHDHYDVKFFVTGSSSFYMKNLFSESLAGRKILFELFPLDFEEFLVFKNAKKEFSRDFKEKEARRNLIVYEKLKKYYDEYLTYGGFPQVVLAPDHEQKELYLKDILTSYFEMDVKKMADFRQMTAFRDLMLLLMQRTGSKIYISSVASEIGISRNTVYSYISFLESTYFMFFLSPFNKNIIKEVRGAKKVYFCDNGILNQFSRISDGAMLENAVFNNLRKYGKLNYYQKRSGVEIDFIMPKKTWPWRLSSGEGRETIASWKTWPIPWVLKNATSSPVLSPKTKASSTPRTSKIPILPVDFGVS